MEAITELTKINWAVFLLTLCTIAFAIKELIEIVSYFKKKFRIKTGFDEEKETIEERIATLEKHDKWQYNEISKISQGIDDIKKQLKERDKNIHLKFLKYSKTLQEYNDYIDRVIKEKIPSIYKSNTIYIKELNKEDSFIKKNIIK